MNGYNVSPNRPMVRENWRSDAGRIQLPSRDMIDRAKRDRLAEALRHLLSGRIDNLAFDALDCPEGIADAEDRAIFEVFYSVWPCYDDFRSHSLQLTDGQRLDFTRYILFLHSNAEFEWPRNRLGIVDYLRRVADEVTGR